MQDEQIIALLQKRDEKALLEIRQACYDRYLAR